MNKAARGDSKSTLSAKKLIEMINALHPDDDTDIEILLVDFDSGLYDFLDVRNVVRNADCSGINFIGINVRLSHRLDG